jgi:hypothetical protein
LTDVPQLNDSITGETEDMNNRCTEATKTAEGSQISLN